MARDEQRMFRIHDAPKPAITAADFQRMMLKRAKAQALARALATARRQQMLAQQHEQQQQNGIAEARSATAQPSQDATADDVTPQPMAIDSVANQASVSRSPIEEQQQQRQEADDGAAGPQSAANGHPGGQQQGADSTAQPQSPADAARAKQQEEAHSAALRRHLIHARKDALSRRRQEEYEAEEARKHREYQREVEEHEAAEAMRRQLASDAAAEAQRLAAEAAGTAAQAEELRVRFEALSAQKAGLVQQLKQTLEWERHGRGSDGIRPEAPPAAVPMAAAAHPPASTAAAEREPAAPSVADIELPPHLAGRVQTNGVVPMVVDVAADDLDLPPHLLPSSRAGAESTVFRPKPPPPPPPLAQ